MSELADELEGRGEGATPGPWATDGRGAVGRVGLPFGPAYPSREGSIMHGADGEYTDNPKARALAAPDTPRFRCKRCGRDEIDCRANGCERGPCPMEFIG